MFLTTNHQISQKDQKNQEEEQKKEKKEKEQKEQKEQNKKILDCIFSKKNGAANQKRKSYFVAKQKNNGMAFRTPCCGFFLSTNNAHVISIDVVHENLSNNNNNSNSSQKEKYKAPSWDATGIPLCAYPIVQPRPMPQPATSFCASYTRVPGPTSEKSFIVFRRTS